MKGKYAPQKRWSISFDEKERTWVVEDYSYHARAGRRHIHFLFAEDALLHIEKKVKEVEAERKPLSAVK